MKKFCSLLALLSLVLMLLPAQPAMAAPTIGLYLDGSPIPTDTPPVNISGRVMVPLRVVSESLGANVSWTSNRDPIVISKGSDQIKLQVGVNSATLNGQTVALDSPPVNLSGRTMVPLRFIGEGLGAAVNYQASPKAVYITSPTGALGAAAFQQANGKPVALTLTASRPILLGESSQVGNEYTLALKSVIAQAEQQDFAGPTGLLHYELSAGTNQTASIRLNLGDDAAFRAVRTALSSDRKTLTVSWPLTLRQAQLVRTGGVEFLSFGVSAAVRPELTDTTVEVSDGGTLKGWITEKVGANLRKGPSTDTEKLQVLALNTQVTVIGETTGWYEVRLSDGTEGWVSDSLVGVECYIAEPVGVNVRTGPGTNYAKIITLYPKEKVVVLERQTGWYRVSYGSNKTGWIADWLVPLASSLTQPTTVPGLKLFFPGIERDCELSGEISQSSHIASLTWEQSEAGTTAIVQLKHAVGYKLASTGDSWRLTFGTWLTNLQFAADATGSRILLTLDGQGQPTLAYDAESQTVVIKLANATLAEGVPVSLTGDGTLVAKAQAAQVGGDVRVSVTLARQTAYHLTRVDDATWEVSFASPTLAGKTIALDPGHGATDPGAMGTKGWNEKDYTHDIINRVRQLLQAAGAKVVTTREISSPYIEAHGRAALINQSGADLFLSVHINSFDKSSVRGLETYYYPRNDNERFARLVQGELVGALGWPDRGVRSNTLYILTKEALTTGVLAEVGYISNPEDESQLFKPEVRQQIAEALYRAIERYFAE